jgi:hypothetical protein
MLNVKNDELVVEEKGIYSVEKFIVARRLMYWQVYLHKTGLAAEKVLERVLKRAKELVLQGVELPASEAFTYFLKNQEVTAEFSNETLKTFAKLDDYDVLGAIKDWISNKDTLLSKLSETLINRKLPKVILQNEPFSENQLAEIRKKVQVEFDLPNTALDYVFFKGEIKNQAYDATKNHIKILFKNGDLKDITEASDHLNIQALSSPVYKYYMCYPKNR